MSEIKKLTLSEAKENFGSARKIFDIMIGDILYAVYDIEGYEHTLGKSNGEPATYWIDRSDYVKITEPDGTVSDICIKPLEPYIGIGVNQICWEVSYKQKNRVKSKWDDVSINGSGYCILKANGKEVYSFGMRDFNLAMARVQTLKDELLMHPYNFINPEEEVDRKIYYYGLPATIKPSETHPGEIGVIPDYSLIPKNDWWRLLWERSNPVISVSDDDDSYEIKKEYHDEYAQSDYINHGDVFCDGYIDWFRS